MHPEILTVTLGSTNQLGLGSFDPPAPIASSYPPFHRRDDRPRASLAPAPTQNMSSFNRVILMGNLTRDPEVRYANSGAAIVKFALAVNRRWQNAEGQWQDEATFVDITMFGKRGEAFSRFHQRGKPALIEGHLRLDTWEDKQTGGKRSKLYVVADTWEFVGGGREGGGEGGGSGGGGQSQQGGGQRERASQSADQSSQDNYGGGSSDAPAYVDDTPF